MKKFLVVILVLSLTILSLLSCNGEPKEEGDEEVFTSGPNTISVMSYNVKVIDLIQEILKSEDSFSNRYDRMKYRIESEKPDLLGLQEATQAHMDKFLEDFGSEYGEVTYYREGGEQALTSITKLFDEAGPILYKKDKFELIEEGKFASDHFAIVSVFSIVPKI